jgi:glycosyltransferase involved in cell wall biosynthesis
MKILIFSQYFWPEYFPINHVAKKLAALNHDVDVLTGNPNYPGGIFYNGYRGYKHSSESWKKVNIIRVPIISRGKSSYFRLCLNYISFISSSFLFSFFLLRKKKYDCILVYGVSPIFQALPAIFLSKIKKIPLTLWVQDLWPESMEIINPPFGKFIRKLIEQLVRFSYLGSDLILIQSPGFLKPILKYVEKNKVQYLPNTVDDIFKKVDKNQIIRIASLEHGFSILFSGNFGSAQGLDCILAAAEKLLKYKDIKFIFVGDGRLKKFLITQKIKRNLSNVYIENSFPVSAMPGIMSQASCLLVSLLDHPVINLTIPSKLQAYLSAGKPIIGCIGGETATIIEKSQSGLICPPGDAEKLSLCILNLYDSPKSRLKKMGACGKKYFNNNFSSDMVVSQMLKYLKTTLRIS